MSRRAAMAMAGVMAMFGGAGAQEHIPGKVEIAWNRYYTYGEFESQLRAIAEAYPDLVRLEPIATTLRGRTLWVAIVNNPATGPDTSKPAMWIDGNVHGNEVQAGEAVMYSLWYLTKAYGQNEELTELLDRCSFYFLPSQNPDGRDYWFTEANTSSSSRHNQRPVDNDRDGLIDEDPPEDIDGDGHITQMWRADPRGDWRRDIDDPRVFVRVGPGEFGDWSFAGQEGIDSDGDGRVNEDGPFAEDMNRNWPGAWMPEFVQFGAGPYPLSCPETRGIADFIEAHPNIAAVQSYHNSGGMVLRGPGARYRESEYPAADLRVYDEIGAMGEQLLPYYRYLIIFRDLYDVHGGFVNWTAESLGIISFTNELWTPGKYFQREVDNPGDDQEWVWRDRIAFGQLFTEYTEHDHPEYGRVLIGGPNKWSSRNTPTFMLEEECHRNFAFTMFHAAQMPQVRFDRTEVEPLGDGLWRLTIEIRNDRVIPTRTARASSRGIGVPDILEASAPQGGHIVSSGRVRTFLDKQMREVRDQPERMVVGEGIGGRESSLFRFIVRGRRGQSVEFRFGGEKIADIETRVVLE